MGYRYRGMLPQNEAEETLYIVSRLSFKKAYKYIKKQDDYIAYAFSDRDDAWWFSDGSFLSYRFDWEEWILRDPEDAEDPPPPSARHKM